MSKLLKRLLIAFFVLFLFLILGWQWAERYGPEQLYVYAQKRIAEATNGRYSLSLDSLQFDLLPLSIDMHNLQFVRDSSNNELSGLSLLDENDITVYFHDLEVKYFKLLRFVLWNQIRSEYILLRDLKVVVRQNLEHHPSSLTPDSTAIDTTAFPDFVDTTVNAMPIIEIDEFRLENASFEFYEDPRRQPLVQVKGLSTTLYGLKSTEDAPIDSKNLDLTIDTITAWGPRYLTQMDLTGLKISEPAITLDSLHFRHVVTPAELNRIKGFQASWLDIQAGGLRLEGIDYELMVADSGMVIRRINLEHLDLVLYKDKLEKRRSTYYKPLLSESVRNVNLPLKIDTLLVEDGRIAIGMQAAAAKKPGVLEFKPVQIQMTNLTNHLPSLEEDPDLVITAWSRVMGTGSIRMDMRFQINSPVDRYWIHGEVGKMPMADLNPFVAPQGLFRFSSGQLERLSFDMTGDKQLIEGTLDFEYSDQRLAKLEDFSTIVDKNPRNGFLIGLANFILPRNNLQTQKAYRQGQIYVERVPERDLFFHITEALSSGIASNLGFGPKDPAKAAARQRAREEKKANREERRRARQEQ